MGYFFFHSLHFFIQLENLLILVLVDLLFKFSINNLASIFILKSIFILNLCNSFKSMSTIIFFAFLAKFFGLYAVIILSSRAPMEINKSEFWIAKLGALSATVPGFPIFNSLESGIKSIAFHVVTTGIFNILHIFVKSFGALDNLIPWPANIIGRFEELIKLRISLYLLKRFFLLERALNSIRVSDSIGAAWTSSGISIQTGPFRPVVAMW